MIFRNNKIIFLLVIFIIFEVGFLKYDFFVNLIKHSDNQILSEVSINDYAEKVIEKCSVEKYRPGCYDKEIPKLLDEISFEDSFRVTRVVQKHEGNEYAYCHVLGHNLSAKETAKDPDKWKDVITRCPSGMCSNGCIHGAFQERFRTESMNDEEIDKLLPELKTVCEARGAWNPTGLERASCYHAVGHLIMFISNGNILKSNEVCEKLSPGFLQMCYDGNFMQIFQPLGQEDIDLVKDFAPKNSIEAETFCNKFSNLKYSSCHQESWPLYIKQIEKPSGLVKFCSYTEDVGAQDRCYRAMFYVLSASNLSLNVVKINDYCSQLPNSKKGSCFANAAGRMIETDYNLGDKAVSLCNLAKAFGVEDQCYQNLVTFSSFNYHPGSKEAKYLCNILPEPWKNKCINKL
jgi:hypothetical protein